jgi:hypothetical protein
MMPLADRQLQTETVFRPCTVYSAKNQFFPVSLWTVAVQYRESAWGVEGWFGWVQGVGEGIH